MSWNDNVVVPLVIHGRILWAPGRYTDEEPGAAAWLPLIGEVRYQDLIVSMAPQTIPTRFSCSLVGDVGSSRRLVRGGHLLEVTTVPGAHLRAPDEHRNGEVATSRHRPGPDGSFTFG